MKQCWFNIVDIKCIKKSTKKNKNMFHPKTWGTKLQMQTKYRSLAGCTWITRNDGIKKKKRRDKQNAYTSKKKIVQKFHERAGRNMRSKIQAPTVLMTLLKPKYTNIHIARIMLTNNIKRDTSNRNVVFKIC